MLGYETKKVQDPVLGERCGRVPPSDHDAEIKDPLTHDDFMYPGTCQILMYVCSLLINT